MRRDVVAVLADSHCGVADHVAMHTGGIGMSQSTSLALPLQALLMAAWRREPKSKVYVHSDRGSQFTSDAWQGSLSSTIRPPACAAA